MTKNSKAPELISSMFDKKDIAVLVVSAIGFVAITALLIYERCV